MNKIKFIIITTVSLLFALGSSAQSYIDLRINEIQKENISSITDENGERCGWIEIFNTSYGMVDVAGCYITDTKQNNIVKNPKGNVFQIPKGNPNTQIRLRGYFILFADAAPEKGAFHMNFTLNGVDHLYLYEPGGMLIDQVKIPYIPEGLSFGRLYDGEGSHEPLSVTQRSARKSAIDSKVGEDGGWGLLAYSTPGITNTTEEVKTKSQRMKEIDPYGIILFLTCFSVVFFALILLFIAFKGVGKVAMKNNPDLKDIDSHTHKDVAIAAGAAVSDEAYAAIAVACYMYEQENEVHDFESDVITFNKNLLNSSSWALRENNL